MVLIGQRKNNSLQLCLYWEKGRTSLANGAAENNSAVYAYKCEKCRKVIIDYSSQNK